MQKRTRVSIYSIWRVIYPMILYMLLQSMIMAVGMMALSLFLPELAQNAGSSIENWSDTAVSFLLLSSALSVILFGFLYRADCEERLEYRQVRAPQRMDGNSILWISVASIAFSMVGNNLIDISPLPELSGSYEETSAMLMSGSLILQLLCVGILAPIVEEILMRGIIFGRLHDMMRPAWAIFWGGLLFGIFHGNIVQGVYASFFGWFLCWLMERFGTIKATCLSHMVSNMAVTLIVGTSLYNQIFENDIVFWVVTIAAAVFFVMAIFLLSIHREEERIL